RGRAWRDSPGARRIIECMGSGGIVELWKQFERYRGRACRSRPRLFASDKDNDYPTELTSHHQGKKTCRERRRDHFLVGMEAASRSNWLDISDCTPRFIEQLLPIYLGALTWQCLRLH